jgi:hypothetical protein
LTGRSRMPRSDPLVNRGATRPRRCFVVKPVARRSDRTGWQIVRRRCIGFIVELKNPQRKLKQLPAFRRQFDHRLSTGSRPHPVIASATREERERALRRALQRDVFSLRSDGRRETTFPLHSKLIQAVDSAQRFRFRASANGLRTVWIEYRSPRKKPRVVRFVIGMASKLPAD